MHGLNVSEPEGIIIKDESSGLETINLILPTYFLTVIITSLSSIYSLNGRQKVACELAAIAVPTLLCITIFSSVILQINVSLLIILLTVYSYFGGKKGSDVPKSDYAHSTKFITNVRATTMFITSIAILAVDFQIFPRRFTKNEKYGFSLMDLGVGLFIYSNGIVASELKSIKVRLIKVLRDCLPLFLLGFARFFVLKEIDYKVPVAEYGVHWNFFLTLAFTKIICSFILKFVSIRFSFFISVIVLFFHEVLLQAGLADFVFSDIPRDDIVSANREGLVSCLGYVGLYFLSVSLGQLLKKATVTQSKKFLLVSLSLSSVVLLCLTCYISYSFGVSRRLANSGYCTWIAFIGVFMTTLYYLADLVQNYFYKKYGVHGTTVPCIFEAINFNGLAYFLVSNLFTGLVNILFDTLKLPAIASVVILVAYLLVKNISIVILYKYKIKLKL